MSELRAALPAEHWARILRGLENARVDNAEVLERLHVQFGRLAPEHGCQWPGLQRANGLHRPRITATGRAVCGCGMTWPHMDLGEWD